MFMPLSCSRCQQGTHPPRLGRCCLLQMQPSGTGCKVSKKIRKKQSEAYLKQLLQQMSQFSCFAESKFMEAGLAEMEQQREGCVGLGAPRMPAVTGFPQLPPWASSRSCAWARNQFSPTSVHGHFFLSMQGSSATCYRADAAK